MTRQRYATIPRTLCFITQGDDVLLLRGAPTKRLWANRLNGVGGHIEVDEDVYSAAVREMQEETGLAVRDVRLRGVVNVAPDPVHGTGDDAVGVMMFVFTAQVAGGSLVPSAEGVLGWYSRREIEEGGLPELVEDLHLLLPHILNAERPFFALQTLDREGNASLTFPVGGWSLDR